MQRSRVPTESRSSVSPAALGLCHGIVALDVSRWQNAESLVDALGAEVAFYKIGLELFTGCGPDAVRRLRDRDKKIFLDLKLHDIPNTVAAAVRGAATLGAELVTVHAGGGHEMIRAAVDAGGNDVGVVAVTALTSLSPERLPAHFRRDVALEWVVLALTEEALGAGAAGVVLSGDEVAAVKRRFGDDCLCIVPGVRAPGGETHDQARVVSPQSALRSGADHLVIGRAIRDSADPLRAWRELWCFETTP